ncbi:MAG: hypothetical protein NTY22_07690 [Proteobacteria bacterium]|nr:hypothetical protein [Pseudomonadota bacterium]
MSEFTLSDLQESVKDKLAYNSMDDYSAICREFLEWIEKTQPTRIISPSHNNYIFYQYDENYGYKITRPINADLFIEILNNFVPAFERFMVFLDDLKHYQEKILEQGTFKRYIQSKEINKVIYTIQQSIGCIGDSFDNPNQCRKRIGQLFETLIRLIIQILGLECEQRIINIPIKDYPGYEMSYQLDLVFSRNKAIIASETKILQPSEVVGSVKTTSKDRIDKLFLDKYLLTKLLGRDIHVIAIFLHDVQRATRGDSIFGINSTFKSNHFLGYTVALNKLDGVYYVDPRPEMIINERLNKHIQDFQQFLIQDLWILSA